MEESGFRTTRCIPPEYPGVDDYALYTSGVPGPLSGDVIFSRTGTDATLGDKLASLQKTRKTYTARQGASKDWSHCLRAEGSFESTG